MFEYEEIKKTLIEPNWQVKIRRVTNGFIISKLQELVSEDDIETYREEEIVFEDGAGDISDITNLDCDDKLISMYYLLNHILEEFGLQYNKHKKINLVPKLEENEDFNFNDNDINF